MEEQRQQEENRIRNIVDSGDQSRYTYIYRYTCEQDIIHSDCKMLDTGPQKCFISQVSVVQSRPELKGFELKWEHNWVQNQIHQCQIQENPGVTCIYGPLMRPPDEAPGLGHKITGCLLTAAVSAD